MVLQVKDEKHFDQILSDSGEEKHGKKFLVVDFYADWCGPCKRFAPTYGELSEQYGESVQFLKVNIDDVPELAARYGIRSIPTFMFFEVGTGSNQTDNEKIIGPRKDKIVERLEYFSGKSLGTNEENFDF